MHFEIVYKFGLNLYALTAQKIPIFQSLLNGKGCLLILNTGWKIETFIGQQLLDIILGQLFTTYAWKFDIATVIIAIYDTAYVNIIIHIATD